MEITWYTKRFNQLTPQMIWKIYQLRIQVFMVEQKSLFNDIDKQDFNSFHLYALDEKHNLVAYCRFYKINDYEASFGRVVVPKKFRGLGLGAELVKQALIEILKYYGHVKVVIASQYYAKGFYEKIGFKPVGKPFTEALRKHIKMVAQL